MAAWSTPARRRAHEILDDAATPDAVRAAAMHDVARSNRLFGGTRAALRALGDVWPLLPRRATMLDVGTGIGDIPASAVAAARRAGIQLTAFGLDAAVATARLAQARLTGTFVGDARQLPVAAASVDLVSCSQLLHHFTDAEALAVLAELHRVARHAVIVSDLRRSRLAATGFHLAAHALRFHHVTRHDGVASVYRGFSADELRSLVARATGATPRVREGMFWRVSVSWSKHTV